MDDLLARDRAHLIHPQHDRATCDAAHVWVTGEGALLTDASGGQYLDGLAGLWNVIAGHGRTELADAAREQMTALAFASGYAGSTNLRAIELAERLAAITYPSINRFFFTSGGAEANETAIKVARSYWKLRGKPAKTKVISRELGYHGVTLAAMSATGHQRLLAPVRASRARVHSHSVAVSLPLPWRGWPRAARSRGH